MAMKTAAGLRKPRSKREGVLPDINVTPLVDVVLVLLIIFMVIAPELEHGERVELPAITTPDDQAGKKKVDPVTVTISAAGSLFLEKEPVPTLDALGDRVKAAHDENPERRILLKGDSSVPYSKFRDALAILQAKGLPGVSLSVTQKDGQGQGQSQPQAEAN
jgi:biopolymer transport protein TolR